MRSFDVIVVGGGPGGMVCGLLLARAGVRVTVLEKHDDFFRDFRGDTVHPSTLTLLDDRAPGLPLLQPVMRAGRRLFPSPPLTVVREHARQQLAALPEDLKQLEPTAPYPVRISGALLSLAQELDRRGH